MRRKKDQVSLVDVIGMGVSYVLAVAVVALVMPHLVHAPTWSDDPAWYVTSAVVGGLGGLACVFACSLWQRRRLDSKRVN